MEQIFKDAFMKKCVIDTNRIIKQLITDEPIQIREVYKKDGTTYKRTSRTKWPINEISKKYAKDLCKKLL